VKYCTHRRNVADESRNYHGQGKKQLLIYITFRRIIRACQIPQLPRPNPLHGRFFDQPFDESPIRTYIYTRTRRYRVSHGHDRQTQLRVHVPYLLKFSIRSGPNRFHNDARFTSIFTDHTHFLCGVIVFLRYRIARSRHFVTFSVWPVSSFSSSVTKNGPKIAIPSSPPLAGKIVGLDMGKFRI